MLFISHDLSVVRSLTDTVVVMYKRPRRRAGADRRRSSPHPRASLYARAARRDPGQPIRASARNARFLNAGEIDARYSALSCCGRASLKPVGFLACAQLVAIAPGHLVEAMSTH